MNIIFASWQKLSDYMKIYCNNWQSSMIVASTPSNPPKIPTKTILRYSMNAYFLWEPENKTATQTILTPCGFPIASSKIINQSASRSMQNFGGSFHIQSLLMTCTIFLILLRNVICSWSWLSIWENQAGFVRETCISFTYYTLSTTLVVVIF